MSNMSVFGKREEWMIPMNKFLGAQRPVFRDYIDRVCAVDRDSVLRVVPASYSTPVTMLGRLGPAAREGSPSLPYLIDPARSFASLVKLWVDSCPADVKRGQVFDDGELLATFHDLCTSLQRRADACLARAPQCDGSAAAAAAEGGKQLVSAESLEQATLIESLISGSGSGSGTSIYPPLHSSPTTQPPVPPLPLIPPKSSGSDGGIGDRYVAQRHSKELRNNGAGTVTGIGPGPGSRETVAMSGNGGSHSSNSGGSGGNGGNGSGSGGSSSTVKGKNNAKVGRTILSGIMRIGGRAESPDSKTTQQQQQQQQQR